MTKTRSLIAVLLTTSAIAVTGYWSIIFIFVVIAPVVFRRGLPQGAQWIGGMVSVIVPTAGLAWWLFKKMQQTYSRRIARAVAFAFGAATPVSLGVALAIAPVAGGYAEEFLGRPYWGFIGALVATFAVAVLLTVAACLFAVRIVRWEEAQGNSTQAQP